MHSVMPRLDANPAGAPQRRAVQGDHAKLLPGDVLLRPGQLQHLRNDSQLKCAQAVIRHGGKLVRIAERHGRILGHIGISASRRRPPRRAKVIP
jgi:hypothetical protein